MVETATVPTTHNASPPDVDAVGSIARVLPESASQAPAKDSPVVPPETEKEPGNQLPYVGPTGEMIYPKRRGISVGWIFLALIAALLIYYVMEMLLFIIGDFFMGAVAFENTGLPAVRALLLLPAGYLAYRLFRQQIRPM